MLFIAVRLRHEGRVLSKFQTDRAWYRGELQVEEAFDKEVRRTVRVARFLEPGKATPTDVFPPLHDVQLIAAQRGCGPWTITGYERVAPQTGAPCDPVSYQQSWRLEVVDPANKDQRSAT